MSQKTEPRLISLGPPRKPGGSGGDHNWTLVLSYPGRAEHVRLYSTSASDPRGAQDAADEHLGAKYTWVPCGPGFRGEKEQA